MSEVDRQLSQAYELIEAGNYSEAREILEPLLVTERDNADVWWMYSHALEDREKAREALENVLRIDPNYEGAEDLLSETRGSPPINIDDHQDDDALIDEFLDSDDFDDDLDDFDDDFALETQTDDAESGGRRTALLGFLMLAIIVIVVVLGFLLLNSGGGDEDDDAQTVAETSPDITETTTIAGSDSTSIPTIGAEESIVQPEETEEGSTTLSSTESSEPEDDEEAVTSEPTEAENDLDNEEETPDTPAQVADATETSVDNETITPEPTEATAVSDDEETPDTQASVNDDSDYDFLYTALSSLSVVDDSVEVAETDFGDTVLVSICTTPGNQLRSDLREAMTAIASQSDSLSDADAAGVRLIDCDEERTINVIAISIQDAMALQSGELEQDAFSSRWRPVG